MTLPKEGAVTASSTIEAIPRDENVDPITPIHNSRKRRKSGDHNRSKSKLETIDINIDTAVIIC